MYLKNKIISLGLCAIIAATGLFIAGNNTVYANPPQTTDPTIEQLQQMVNSLLAQIQQMIALIAQLKPLETCGNGICRFGETAASCAADCQNINISAEPQITIYERTGEINQRSFKVSDLMKEKQSFSTNGGEAYHLSFDGKKLTINCFRAGNNSGHAVGNNIIALKLSGIAGHPDGVWASSIVDYSLGTNGIAESRFNALGELSALGPYNNSDCTYLGDQTSQLTVAFENITINPFCGNGICESLGSETAANCTQDCGMAACATVGEIFINDTKKCCAGLEKTLSNQLIACQIGDTACGTKTNYTCQKPAPTPTTAQCAEKCKAMGYANSNCNTYGGLMPPGTTVNRCQAGYTNIGTTDDCNNTNIVDAGRTCCCANKINTCTTEGNVLTLGQSCCSGLKAINYSTKGSLYFQKQVCANCGNGNCGAGETNQNCPQDCDYAKLTCAQTCAQEGYPQGTSYCNSWTSTPGQSTNTCAAGEFGIGWTTDCNMSGTTPNTGRTCCCNKQNSSYCGKTYNYDPSYNSIEVNSCKAAGGVISCSGSILSCYCNCNTTCKADASQKSCLKYLANDGALLETNYSSICAKELQIFKGCDQSCKPIVECGSAPVCGNQSCDSGETAANCPADCVAQEALPDLVVKDVFYQPACGLYVTYCNIGKTTSSQTFLIKTKSASGEYGGNYYYPFQIPAAGRCKTTGSLTISLIGAREGDTKEVTATIDWQNTVQEADDNNNTLTKTIQFPPAQGNCNYYPADSSYN